MKRLRVTIIVFALAVLITTAPQTALSDADWITVNAWSPDGIPYVNGVLLGSLSADVGPDQTVPAGTGATALVTAEAQSLPSPTILAVAWSPDGSKLAVAGTQGMRVMDVASNQELPGFEDAAPPVYAIAWSPDGNKLASSGADKLINIWDVSNGTLITSLAGHDFSRLADMEWSPDGTRLASAAATIDDFTLRIWDMVNALPLAQFDASSLAEVVWSSDSSQLIVANTIIGVYIFDSSLAIPNAEGIQEYRIGPIEPIGSIALHPDGTTLAIGSFYQPVIYLWDIAANQQIGILQGHTDFVLALDWRPGSDTLVSVALDGTLRTWDAASGQQIDVIDVGAKLYAVDWSPDGSRLVYGGETPDGQTEILKTIQFPVADVGPDQTVPAGTGATALVTADGTSGCVPSAAAATPPWAISVQWTLSNYTLVTESVSAKPGSVQNICSMDWSADGTRFAITTRSGLSIYDRSLNQIAYQAFPTAIEFTVPSISLSPDGTRIFVGNDTEKHILDTTTLAPVVDFQNASIQFDTPQWNSDGSEIAFRRVDGRGTEIYDATTGNLMRSFSSQAWSYGFFNLDGFPLWSPDDVYFAGIIGGDTVIIFEATNGQELTRYQIGSEQIYDLAWSTDQTNPRLALSTRASVEPGSPDSFPDPTDSTKSERYSVFVVDALKGTVLSSTTGLRDPIWRFAWSSNSLELVGRDAFRRLYVWDPSTGNLIDSYLTETYDIETLKYSPYGGRLLLAYNIRFETQQRTDDEFIPLSTFAQTEFNGVVQFVAPASSPKKIQSILSQCATDPDIVATGNSLIASGQYGEFAQWLGQQDESIVPPVCADDLQLMVEAVSMTAPLANAGPDQTVIASSSGAVQVTLDGTSSTDSDGTIVAYRWYEKDTLITEGMTPQVELGVGEHTITLVVEDDDGAAASDEVVITVVAASGCVPVAPADPPATAVWTRGPAHRGAVRIEYTTARPQSAPDCLTSAEFAGSMSSFHSDGYSTTPRLG